MLRSSLCDYGDTYILVIETIKITGEGADDAEKPVDERNKGGYLKTVHHSLNA